MATAVILFGLAFGIGFIPLCCVIAGARKEGRSE